MRKDFYRHSTDCFFKDVGNNFTFPTKYCYFLVKGDSGQDEVLVKTWYDGEMTGFKSFMIQSSDQSFAKPSKLKTVIENPDDSSFRMEVVTEIETGPYRDNVGDDFVLGTVKQGMRIHFELIY